MADAAHKKTDEYIAEIQKRVTREYRAAEKDAQKKLEDYLKRFAEKDRKQREKLNAGEITKAQYQEWRRRQIVTGERWKALRDTIAKDYHNASQIAQKIAKDKLPDVYALNHNYATYSIEKEAGINTSYTLYNHSTVERMLRENPKLLPDPTPGSATAARLAANKDLRWNQQHIQSAVTRGIMLGDDIGSIAKRLRSVTDMDYSASMRNARTAVTGAQNAGREDAFERAESMGIEIVREWVATLDSRTRDSHRAMHGEERDEKSGTFSNGLEYPGDTAGPPEEVYNCFVGSTIAYANNEILRSYKHWYDGDLIEIKTAGGVSFSVTPNHPILSIDGWVHANALHEGDNILVADFSGDSISGYPDINHIPARMDAFHKFFNKFGSKRTCSLGVNFHGDVPTSDVEIVTKKWFLLNNRNPGRSKSIDKFLLKFANKSFMSKSPFSKHLWSIAFSTLGNVRRMSKMLSFIFGSMCHAVIHSGRAIPDLDIVLSQNSIDNLSAEAILSGKGLDGLTGKVSTDKIVSVKTYSFHGYVYNLQTKDNYYCVNSIISGNGKYAISHNCRCTMISHVAGHDVGIPKMSPKMQGQSFEEWQEGRKPKRTLGAGEAGKEEK